MGTRKTGEGETVDDDVHGLSHTQRIVRPRSCQKGRVATYCDSELT